MNSRNAELAKRIAAELFTTGANEQAASLRMHNEEGAYLGGWCESAVVNVICKHLDRTDRPTGVWLKLSVMASRIGRRVNSLSRTIERNHGQAPGLEIERRLPATAAKRGKIVRVRASEEFYEWLKVTQKIGSAGQLSDADAGNLFAIGMRRRRQGA